MAETLQTVDGCESARDVKRAFRRFNRRTSALRQTYMELRKEAELMNLELKQTNRQLEEKIQELEEAYSFQHCILENLPIGVTVTDMGGAIQHLNRAAKRIWEVDAEQAVGKSCREVMGRYANLLESILSGECGERTVQRELAGKQIMLETTVSIARDSDGTARAAIQLDRDVSNMRKLQNQLCRRDDLADLGRSAAGVAHEVRKPLNGIKGFASLLKRIADDKSANEYSDRIINAASRLDSMLNQLLDFAKPTVLELETVNLKDKAERVAEFVRSEEDTSQPDIPIEVNISQGARVAVGDPGKIEQVLLNLVENGVEAIEETGRVSVTAEPTRENGNRKIKVTVEDTGQGISPDKLDSIQQPFTSYKEDGTGLGLAMVNKFLRIHGTELSIDSEPGRGTKMEFNLPARDEGSQT